MELKEVLQKDKWFSRKGKNCEIRWNNDFWAFVTKKGHTIFLTKEYILSDDWYFVENNNTNYFL